MLELIDGASKRLVGPFGQIKLCDDGTTEFGHTSHCKSETACVWAEKP